MNKKIINELLIHGKKTTSEKVWLKSIKYLNKLNIKNPKKLISRSIINVAPLFKIKQLKNKKRRLQLKEFPYIVRDKNRISSALKFISISSEKKIEAKIHKLLVTELLRVANNSGISINKKKNLYDYAFLKKKYFFFRWF